MISLPNLPKTSREIRLKTRPHSLPRATDFEIVEVPLPVIGADEVLVRNRHTRVSASLRMMISEGAEAVEGVPFPALGPGDTLSEETLGEVIAAPADSGLRPGDLVQHFLGWREYAAVPTADCVRIDGHLPDPVAHLSHGWTAYAALTRGVQIRPGDTVFITSAAGAIGSMAGQIARLLGAGRVIGSTGSKDKADRLVDQLRYDAAVVRGERSIAAQLKEVAPEGIDVLLDNVGGEQLQAAVGAAREGARFVLTGALSGQLASRGTGRTAPVELDSFQLLLKKITLRGYSADDDPDARDEWIDQFATWLRSGSIVFPHVVLQGIESAPEAIQMVAEGKYFGTVVVAL
jgi:NADPH-dependent curcumin reductase CurA